MSTWIVASNQTYYPSVSVFSGLHAERNARNYFEEEKGYLGEFDDHSVYIAEVVEEVSAESIVFKEYE